LPALRLATAFVLITVLFVLRGPTPVVALNLAGRKPDTLLVEFVNMAPNGYKKLPENEAKQQVFDNDVKHMPSSTDPNHDGLVVRSVSMPSGFVSFFFMLGRALIPHLTDLYFHPYLERHLALCLMMCVKTTTSPSDLGQLSSQLSCKTCKMLAVTK
jgi:hypothetical protein